jgi:MFS family permease
MLAATTTINFFTFMFAALFVLYATRALHVRPGLLGLVLGAGAVGGLLGTVITGRLTRRIGVGWAMVTGCVAYPAPLLLVPLAGGPRALVLALLFFAEFGSGLGVMILDITFGAVRAAAVPARLQGRVSGAFQAVNYGVRPFGSLAGGALGAAIGLRPTLWVATAGAVLGFGWLLPSPVPRLKSLPAAASFAGDRGEQREAGGPYAVRATPGRTPYSLGVAKQAAPFSGAPFSGAPFVAAPGSRGNGNTWRLARAGMHRAPGAGWSRRVPSS